MRVPQFVIGLLLLFASMSWKKNEAEQIPTKKITRLPLQEREVISKDFFFLFFFLIRTPPFNTPMDEE